MARKKSTISSVPEHAPAVEAKPVEKAVAKSLVESKAVPAVEAPPVPEAADPQKDAPVPTGLTVTDLTLVLQIINTAATRGAFKADELATVGGVHDRIYKFLDSVGAIPKNSEPADAAPATN